MDEEDEHFLVKATGSAFYYQEHLVCHIINYLITELARAVPGNIGPGRFRTDHAALGPYCHDLGPIFPSTALALG